MTVPAPDSSSLDLRGLSGPVSVRDVGAYYRRADVPLGRRWWATALVVGVYLTAQAVFLRILLPATGLSRGLLDVVYGGFLVFTGIYAIALSAVVWLHASRPVRIARAARANGLSYSERGHAGSVLPGTVLPETTVPMLARDVLERRAESASGLPQFTASTVAPQVAGTRRAHGVAAVRLEQHTPHIVLENRRARVMRRTGRRFRKNQHLSLEGDFDRTFTLHCPSGYERDALYIFTPDLMALMIDLAPDCEAELVDGSLVLYSGRPWRLWTPHGFTRLLTLVRLVGLKARSRTEFYRDDRSASASAVALPGRRLRVRPSLGALASIALPTFFTAYGLVSLLGGIF